MKRISILILSSLAALNLHAQSFDELEHMEKYEGYFDFYYNAIQKGLSEDAIKPYPVDLIGEMLYRSIIAIMNLVKTTKDRAQQEEFIQAGFEIFWNGIRVSIRITP